MEILLLNRESIDRSCSKNSSLILEISEIKKGKEERYSTSTIRYPLLS